MTTNTNTPVAPFGAITTYRMVHFLEGFLSGYRARRRATETEKALHKLSDRELRDIGLDRSAIHGVARRLAGF